MPLPRPRYLEKQVKQDLKRKMVFIGGPRQVGKTTMALKLLGNTAGYLNWDIAAHRKRILKEELPVSAILLFDEIHKYRSWRNYLKGLYDDPSRTYQILVTGSAKLDLYRFGGDSLQGRYHYLRLHPFSVAELKIASHPDFHDLLSLGGFPEPFLASSKEQAERWSNEYRSRFIREDLMGLERVQDLGNLELLMLRLPDLVGSPLSINALRENLQLNHRTVATWLDIFERLYFIFRLMPFGAPRIRAVKKEQKHYHFDWSLIDNQASRFENLVAAHLLKWVHFEQDSKGRNLDLRYFRDVTRKEVDFVVLEKRELLVAVECKWGDAEIDKGLRYLKNKFPRGKFWQISAQGKKDYISGEGIRVCPALRFLQDLM